MLKTSLIVCSRNRRDQLHAALGTIHALAFVPEDMEVILVDTDSTDGTKEVMQSFAADSPWPVTVLNAERRGLSVARNLGLSHSNGDLIVFTDDDCYMDPNYFRNLGPAMECGRFQFGSGGITLHDPQDAAIGVSWFKEPLIIPPHSVISPGSVQGANAFFLRKVFEEVGVFREDMGSGTEFPAEDIELATRASLHGFTGILLPAAVVRHHHQRRPDSPELKHQLLQYDRGCGAYFANLIAEGNMAAFQRWAVHVTHHAKTTERRRLNERLQREFQAASEFLARWLSQSEDEKAQCIPPLFARK